MSDTAVSMSPTERCEALLSRYFAMRSVLHEESCQPDTVEKYTAAMQQIADHVLANGTAEQLVRLYISKRDDKKTHEDAYKASIASIEEYLVSAEVRLRRLMKEQGIDSIKTSAGTAYRTTKTSTPVEDWDKTLEWLKADGMWNFLERKVNKTAVMEYRKLHDALPPGVGWREEEAVNVRR